MSVPYFTAFRKSEIAALARNANGLRLTLYSSNSGSGGMTWPYSDTGAVLRFPLAGLPRDMQVDCVVATNADSARAVGGTDLMEVFAGVVRRYEPSGRAAYVLGGVWLYTYYPDFSGAASEYAVGPNFVTTDTQRDVSSSGEGTVSNITVRAVRIVLRGDTVEVLTGPVGGALTRRVYYESVTYLDARDGLAFILSIAQAQSTPRAGYLAELRGDLVITPL